MKNTESNQAGERTQPLDALRHHVTGAIERGEATAIVEQRTQHTPGPKYQSGSRIFNTEAEAIEYERVNGISDEMPIKVLTLPEENKRLLEINAELLEALRGLMDLQNVGSSASPEEVMAGTAALAAIAKAEGK